MKPLMWINIRFTFFYGVFLLVFTPHIFAASADLSTPKKCIEFHLKYASESNANSQKKSIQVFEDAGLSAKELTERSNQLLQIYKGLGIDLSTRKLSNNPNHYDSTVKAHHYAIDSLVSGIYLEKVNGNWLYSAHSVRIIPKIHQEVYPFGTDVLLNVLSGVGHRTFLGLYSWQYIAIAILCLIAFLVHKIVTFIFDIMLVRILKRLGYYSIAKPYYHKVAKPLSLQLILSILVLFVPLVQLPPMLSDFVRTGLKAAIPFFLMLVFYHLVDILNAYLEKLASKTESTLDDQLVPLGRKVMKVLVIVIGTLMVLRSIGFDITAILAGISIGGLAVALAAQDMLKNFFGSIMIFVDKPFQIGDWIVGDRIEGDVLEVGFRSTRVKTANHSIITVPNGKVADMVVDNLGLRTFRRYKLELLVPVSTPTQQLELYTDAIKKLVEKHPLIDVSSCHVYYHRIVKDTIELVIIVNFNTKVFKEETTARNQFNMAFVQLTQVAHIALINEISPQMPSTSSWPDIILIKKSVDDFVESYKF